MRVLEMSGGQHQRDTMIYYILVSRIEGERRQTWCDVSSVDSILIRHAYIIPLLAPLASVGVTNPGIPGVMIMAAADD